MTMATTKAMTLWTDEERTALRSLAKHVYPEGQSADWPGRFIDWASPEWGTAVTDERGELVSYAGLVIRDGRHDGQSVRIGGIGGVKTHPDHRGLGYAAAAMREAHRFFVEERTVDFGLLVCDDSLLPYYAKLGWSRFEGTMLTDQPEGKVIFTFNRVMTTPVATASPRVGVIDLDGPPW